MADTPPKPRLQLLNGTLARTFTTDEAHGWPALAGTVRPATPREVREYVAAKREHDLRGPAGAGELVAFQSKFFAGLLRTWNVDDGDAPAPITPESVARLPDPVFVQLENVCLGYAAGDLLGNSPASS